MTTYHLLSAWIGLGTPAAVTTTPFSARFLLARLSRRGRKRWLGRGGVCPGPGRDPAPTPSRRLGLLTPFTKQRDLQPFQTDLGFLLGQRHPELRSDQLP